MIFSVLKSPGTGRRQSVTYLEVRERNTEQIGVNLGLTIAHDDAFVYGL